ncbi:UDP-N-acetylmuramoylalanine-D-glutamate ligase [Gracilibacillus boraciitolerans JCM 21714]|uniref:UDP-N-acetylmuramoylalanine--D-glutamate ligase n=1 Tax=Gracilibacillus boraciitolerans JCM 21714 TaxID=1298598 RepID=W4VFZ3_9BACI|nr:UDP-N-acetylmuramoyl-L-alanine--D-glutamate ligase [Gracilibacillus boraciitolerans]GAE91738.1 UDP-N-acetylmuramoylalanine-D-glutamate ligase [Gracilibacillus boraciitolerans JCM 21714]
MRKLNHFPYQKVLVLGLAKSGTAVAKLLAANGINVVANDLKASENNEHVQQLRSLDIPVVLGDHPLELLENVDVIIKNPGIPYENILVEKAMEYDIPILTEIELIPYFGIEHLVAITGSNGKTTTTTLIYEMYKKGDVPVCLAGNIGHVASEVAAQMSDRQTMVAELSSFQLLGIDVFKPKVAVLLNLFEAHLDYHHTLENYHNAKANIFKNQTEHDYLVYNYDDERVVQITDKAQSKLIPFSRKQEVLSGTYCKEQAIYFQGTKVIDLESIALVGEHNLENILAAISVSKIEGISNQSIQDVLTTFTGVSHRLQFVKKVEGRLFYNDSKATNILATTKALGAFQQPTILLAGGLDRGNEFDELGPFMKDVKALVLFGETANKIKKMGEAYRVPTIKLVETMSEAVQYAYDISSDGDVVLLSPACASWDQYKTFEERGNMFMDYVHNL